MEDYTVIRAIGKGSFGKVYLVRHTGDARQYVMKVIKLKGIPPKEREACRNEVMLMQRLQHPNIVAYKDSFFANGRDNLCIVMTYCDGGDLAARLAAAKGALFKEDQIMHWFVQIALAIHYMHENKVLHRDIKTQNIFLLGNGRLVLGDLGISKVLDGPVGFASTQIGTPYYMSPELFKNKPYNHKSDVWALGCVLCACPVNSLQVAAPAWHFMRAYPSNRADELCTLQHPFDATSLNALAQKIGRGVYAPINPKYSQSLRALIASMLAINPASRPGMADILTQPYIKKHIYNFLKDIASRSAPMPALGGAAADAPVSDGTMMFRAAALKVAGPGGSGGADAMARAASAGLGPHAVNLQSQLTALGLQPVVMKALEDAATGSTAVVDFMAAASSAAGVPKTGAAAIPMAPTSLPTGAGVPRVTPAALLGAAPSVAAAPAPAPAITPTAAVPDPRVARKVVKEQQAALDREEERRRAVEMALAKLREEKELRAKQREEFRRKQERMALRGGSAVPSAAALPPRAYPSSAVPAVAPAPASAPSAAGAFPPGKIRVVPVGSATPATGSASASGTPSSVASAPASSSSSVASGVGVRGRAVPLSSATPPAGVGAAPRAAPGSGPGARGSKSEAPVSARGAPAPGAGAARDAMTRRAEMEKKRVAELDAWERDRVQRAHAKAVGISALHAATPAPAPSDAGSAPSSAGGSAAASRNVSRGKERVGTVAAPAEPVGARKPSPAAVPSSSASRSSSVSAAASEAERNRRVEADRQARDDRKAREDARWAQRVDDGDVVSIGSSVGDSVSAPRSVASSVSIAPASSRGDVGIAGRAGSTKRAAGENPSQPGGLVRASSTPSIAGAPPLVPSGSTPALARNGSASSVSALTPAAALISGSSSDGPHMRKLSVERVPAGGARAPSPIAAAGLAPMPPRDNSPTMRGTAAAEATHMGSSFSSASSSLNADAYLPDNFEALSAKDKVLARREAVRRAEEDRQRHLLHAAAVEGQSERKKAQYLAREQYRGVGAAIAGALPINSRVLEESVADATELVATLTAGPSAARYGADDSVNVSKIDTIPEEIDESHDSARGRGTRARPVTAGSELPSESKLHPHSSADADEEDLYGTELDRTDPAMLTAISEDSDLGAPEPPTPLRSARRPGAGADDVEDRGYLAGELPDTDSEDSVILEAAAGQEDEEGSDTDGADDMIAESKLDDAPVSSRSAGPRVVSVRSRPAAGAAAAPVPSLPFPVPVPPPPRRRPQIALDNGSQDDADIKAQEETLRTELMRSTMRCNNLRASLEVARKFMADMHVSGAGSMPTHTGMPVSARSAAGGVRASVDGSAARMDASVLAAALPRAAYPGMPSAAVVDDRPIRPSADPTRFGQPVGGQPAPPGSAPSPSGSSTSAPNRPPAAMQPSTARGVLAPSAAAAAAAGGYLSARPPLPTSGISASGGHAHAFSGPTIMYSVADDEEDDLDDDLGDEDGDMEGGIDFRHVTEPAIPEETEADVAEDSAADPHDDDAIASGSIPARHSQGPVVREFKSHLAVDNATGYTLEGPDGGGEYLDLPTRMERLRKKCIVGLGAAAFDYVYNTVKTQMLAEEAEDTAGTLDLSEVRMTAGPDKHVYVDEVVRLVNLEQTFL